MNPHPSRTRNKGVPAAADAVSNWLGLLGSALERHDVPAALELFADDCCWRDRVSFGWDVKTRDGKDQIRDMLDQALDLTQPRGWQLDGEPTVQGGVTDAAFTFETSLARGRGRVRLKDGKGWTVLTTAVALKGFEGPTGERTLPAGPALAERDVAASPTGRHAEIAPDPDGEPHVVLVGRSEPLAARLGRLGVPALVVDRGTAHSTRAPADTLWTSAAYDLEDRRWTVWAVREGRAVCCRPRQLLLSLTVRAAPQVPEVAGAAGFRGVQRHVSGYRGGAAWQGRSCVVVGDDEHARWVCADLRASGAAVTWLPGGVTPAAAGETLADETPLELAFAGRWAPAGATHESLFATAPYALLERLGFAVSATWQRRDADLHHRLGQAGFALELVDDDTGLGLRYRRCDTAPRSTRTPRAGDAPGAPCARDGRLLQRILPHGVALSDGSEIAAQLIVYATGDGDRPAWVTCPSLDDTGLDGSRNGTRRP